MLNNYMLLTRGNLEKKKIDTFFCFIFRWVFDQSERTQCPIYVTVA